MSVPQWGKVGLAVSGIAAKCSAGDVSDVKKHLAELVETAMRSPLSSMIAMLPSVKIEKSAQTKDELSLVLTLM